MKFLQLKETSEDDSVDFERNEVDKKEHLDDGDAFGTNYCHVGTDNDSQNEDDNESAGESAQWEDEGDHNDDKGSSGDSRNNVPGDGDGPDNNDSRAEDASNESEPAPNKSARDSTQGWTYELSPNST